MNNSEFARTEFDEKDMFALKGQILMELRENAFDGLEHEDANEHIDKIFKLADLFKIENMTFDRLMLTIFPLSLWGDARRWLNNEPMESITNWS